MSSEKLISKSSSDEKLRESFENNSGMNTIKNITNWGLTVTGKGDALKALYRKK